MPIDLTIDLNVHDSEVLPKSIDNVKFMCSATVIPQSKSDLQLKPDTLTMNFNIPASSLTGTEQDARFYLVY